MRAPDDKKQRSRPGFKDVPIESACWLAGKEPKNSEAGRAKRRDWDRRIARLFASGSDPAEVTLVACYFKGEFDRWPTHGRPPDPWRRVASDNDEYVVRRTQREQKCSLRRAIELSAPCLQLDDVGCHRLVEAADPLKLPS